MFNYFILKKYLPPASPRKILDLREALEELIIFFQNEKMNGPEKNFGSPGTEATAGEGGRKLI